MPDSPVSAAAQICANSSALSEAPPTRPPSMSALAKSSRAFDALTLPPYRILTELAIVASSAATLPRIIAWTSCACSGLAVRPVPIAQTGS
jgi:hypothetical protein